MKKLSADLDGPKYNTPFEIVGFQALTEKGKYTELIEVIIENKITLKNRKDYLKWKEETGKEICNAYNSMLRTLEQIRKEAEGDILTVNGVVDVNIEAQIQEHIQQEIYKNHSRDNKKGRLHHISIEFELLL